MKTYYKIIAWVLLFSIIAFFHVWKLTSVPYGLHVDETSVAYNAALIAETGFDEHDKKLPIFFKAFGEYKNPLYIYATAGVFKVFGISEFTLRFTSALFFFWFIAVLTVLVQRIWKNHRISFLIVLTAGFLPHFFPLSRISFEVVSLLPITATWLLLLHQTYVNPPSKISHILLSLLAGMFLGMSVYAYSTSRLLAFLFVVLWVLFFTNRKTWQRTLAGITGFMVTLIPYAIFASSNPGALTNRFKQLTYIYDASLTLWDKVFTFIGNYLHYFSPEFLIIQGDTNIRHGTGFGGIIFGATFILLALGIVAVIKKWRSDRFALFIMSIALVSPIPGALSGMSSNALRSVPLGIAILILGGYGLSFLRKNNHWKTICTVLILLISLESASYLNHYFTQYQAASMRSFFTAGLQSALTFFLKQSPSKIILSPDVRQVERNKALYSYIFPELTQKPFEITEPVASKGTCVIYPTHRSIDNKSLDYIEINKESLVTARCYLKY